MTDKVQKIREEVEKIKTAHSSIDLKESNPDVLVVQVCTNLLSFIDSMQKESISEDLEIAANEWDAKASFNPFYMALDDNGNPYEVRQDYTTHAESFKAGAKWQKEQMMANAIDGDITFDYYGDDDKTYGCIAHNSFCLEDFGLKDRDKVKMILIKEE